MRVLVTGGAGYIGSHTVVQLVAAGHEAVIVDNFCNSKRSVVDRIRSLTAQKVGVYEIDLRDEVALADAVVRSGPFDAVIHFAGLKSVQHSVELPLEYYNNNLISTINLLGVMQRNAITTLVFSSSATVYGSNPASPLTESLHPSATNPYGWTKVFIEQILRDVALADPSWRVGILRYFNPVGAHPSGLLGEDPSLAATNLMPIIARVALGTVDKLRIFGGDYDTADGTGVRDYIHVQDLASGHLAALKRLTTTDRSIDTWNLGTGRGTSVLQLLRTFEQVSGKAVPYEIIDRRPGDVATSFADPSYAQRDLSWRAGMSIADMCADAWRWYRADPSETAAHGTD